jgi:ribonuclease T2
MLRLVTISRFLIAAAAFVAVSTGIASAQDRRQNAPGEFDFYVLSLSWSPSFCEGPPNAATAGARRPSAADVHSPL